jgi:hypothetical protein
LNFIIIIIFIYIIVTIPYCILLEHYLRILDPKLSHHLEENYIQSQLYGLRWSRLLLGREFTLVNHNMLKLWDFMFASSFDAENNTLDSLLDDSVPPNVYSVLANVRFLEHKKSSNQGKRLSKNDKVIYVCTPILGALGDIMLSMFMQVKQSS